MILAASGLGHGAGLNSAGLKAGATSALPAPAQSPAPKPEPASKPEPGPATGAKSDTEHTATGADRIAGLEGGFRELYELRFEEARGDFAEWEAGHAGDPMGAAAEAASYLFEEFYKQGVLTSEFFLDDEKFLEGIEGQPTPHLKKGFFAALERGEKLIAARLKKDARDTDALYTQALLTGMLGNYRSLVEKQHFEGLRLTERAEGMAEELLELKPDAQDAWLAIGASNYIVGCLPRHKRFFLWFGGVAGNRQEGMAQLKRAAEGGRLLRPYAKIMLALAALREKDAPLAERLFAELAAEFPRNPQFARELARLRKNEAGTQN